MLAGRTTRPYRKNIVEPISIKDRLYPVIRDVPIVPDVIVVKMKKAYPNKTFEASFENTLQKIGILSINHEFAAHREDRTELSKIFRIKLPANVDIYKTVERLSHESSVIWAEPIYLKRICYVPNDPNIDLQWHLAKIQAREAWDIFKGSSEILIGIVDNGFYYDHPDLAANIWINPAEIPDNHIDDDANGYIDDWHGWDVADNDNDPYPSPVSSSTYKYHGTMVAGVASGVTDNGIGIAAPAFNAKILTVKATGDNEDPRYLSYTYLGITYAAEMGADIINCSFSGGPSNIEREAVRYAQNLGTLVIAAAGNEGVEDPVYPANYPGVLSVAATNPSDRLAIFTSGSSNYGNWVDVSAPGDDIYSTYGNLYYTSWDGTSFSSPLTASAVALVMGYHPNWTAQQAAQQVRISADQIDALNFGYEHKLGYGRINAYRALTYISPAVRIVDVLQEEGSDGNGNSIIDPGEEACITLTVTNYFMSVDQITLALSTDSPLATLTAGNFSGIHLGEMESWSNTGNPVRIQINAEAERGQKAGIFVSITGSGGYQDYDYFEIEIPYSYSTVKGADVRLTLTSNGNMAYADYSDNFYGDGFVFGPYANLLFEGAVMAATDALHVSDAARGENEQVQNKDFTTSLNGELMIREPGPLADEQGETVFNDDDTVNPIHLGVEQTALAFYDTLYGDFVLLHYRLDNLSSETIRNLHFALFMDWDVGLNPNMDSGTNMADFDNTLNLGYIFKEDPPLSCGVQVLSGNGAAIYRCIDNPTEIYDGYSDTEKWADLSGGVQDTLGDVQSDYSHVVGIGPFDIDVDGSVVVGFAVLGGESLSDLKRNAALAKTKWQAIFENTGADPDRDSQPLTFRLMGNYPNPFNSSTVISYDLPAASYVILTVHDLRGREIARLSDRTQEPGRHTLVWNGATQNGPAASGVYFCRIQAGSFVSAGKMILLK